MARDIVEKINSPVQEQYINLAISLSSTEPSCFIVTVTDTETEAFYNVLEEKKIAFSLQKHPTIGCYSCFKLKDQYCGLIRPVRKGNAATQALVSEIIQIQPKVIMMTGVCGGFHERGAKLNDVIFAQNVIYYERERLSNDEYKKGIQPRQYHASASIMKLIANLKIQLEQSLHVKIHHEKSLATGEKVLANQNDLRQRILELSPDIYGVEMEGFGFFHAIWSANSQTDAAIIKAVSDFTGEDMGIDKESKQLAAATIAAKVTLEVIDKYFK